MSLRLENGDFVLKPIIDALFLLQIERGVCAPRDLSIRKAVHVGWLCRFSFSFIQDSLSSFHFRVTFISVKIEDALSARIACLATNIFPVILLAGASSSCLRLLIDSERGFC